MLWQHGHVSQKVMLPATRGPSALHRALLARRSAKEFADAPLDLDEVANALWAAAGTTAAGHRVCPSARATYPISVTLLAARVNDLATGAYCYDPFRHALNAGPAGDHRHNVADATLDAGDWLPACPALVLLTSDLDAARERFPGQPPEHGEHFVWIEAGHAAQNIYLWGAERHLGVVLIAGLDDSRVTRTCRPLVPQGHSVLGIIAIGHAAT